MRVERPSASRKESGLRRKWVIVSGSYPEIRCGVSPYVKRVAELLARRGEYEVHVLTSADELVDVGAARGYEVHASIRGWGLWDATRICREILRLDPAVVEIQNPTIRYNGWRSVLHSAVVPYLKRRAPQVRVLVMQHDIAVGRRLLRGRYVPQFLGADAILVSNKRDRCAIEGLGIQPSKIYEAPMSSYVQPSGGRRDATAARRRLGIPLAGACVVYFGYVLPGRNVDVLIRALSILHQKGNPVHGLILGGPHADAPGYPEQCRELARKLGIAGQLTWTGFAGEDKITDGLASADVFVSLPERGADMRNTSILTGILAELPVITSVNGRYGIDCDLEGFGCAFVDPHDGQGLAEAIERMVQDGPSRAELLERAGRLDPDAVWERHVAIHVEAAIGMPFDTAQDRRNEDSN